MAILTLKNIHYRYDDAIPALKNISLSIEEGEKIVILGNNGAGKTTFFRICNGLLTPDSGQLLYDGTAVKQRRKDLLALRKAVNLIFQDADSQIIAPTVESEISFGLMNLNVEPDNIRIILDEVLHDLSLEHLKERPPHYLSGGEKKRVSIADALVMQPRVMLMDEPMASLDPANADHFEQLLEGFHEQGIALVIASHDVDFAWRWAHRIVVFHQGEIIADDAPEVVFSKNDIIEKANLKQPVLYEICEIFIDDLKKYKMNNLNITIKNMEDFKKILQEIKIFSKMN